MTTNKSARAAERLMSEVRNELRTGDHRCGGDECPGLGWHPCESMPHPRTCLAEWEREFWPGPAALERHPEGLSLAALGWAIDCQIEADAAAEGVTPAEIERQLFRALGERLLRLYRRLRAREHLEELGR